MSVVKRRDAAWAEAQKIASLAEAHDVLPRLMPRKGAALAEMRQFHERSAEIYRRVAEIDRGHHHEALYWADREAQKAQELDG